MMADVVTVLFVFVSIIVVGVLAALITRWWLV